MIRRHRHTRPASSEAGPFSRSWPRRRKVHQDARLSWKVRPGACWSVRSEYEARNRSLRSRGSFWRDCAAPPIRQAGSAGPRVLASGASVSDANQQRWRSIRCFQTGRVVDRCKSHRRLSLGEVQRATACILAVQLLRTTCHLSCVLVTAWSCEVSVPVSRNGDHTAPSFGDTVPGHSLRDRTFATRADELSRSRSQQGSDSWWIEVSLIAIGPVRRRPPCGRAGQYSRSSIAS